MGEFKECYMWIKLAFLAMALGFACDLFGFAIGMGDEDQTVTGLLIAGLVTFLIAFVLALVVTFFDEAVDSKIVKAFLILFAVAAGVLTIVGIGIWGGRGTNSRNPIGCYSSLVAVCGSALAILTGIFTTIDLSGHRAGSR